METREELKILEDDGSVIKFEEATIVTDEVSREKVAEIKELMNKIENEISLTETEIQEKENQLKVKNDELEHYRAVLSRAEAIIAQAERRNEVQTETQESVEVEDVEMEEPIENEDFDVSTENFQ